MRIFIAVLQGYERESGRGFRVRYRVRVPDAGTARALVLEEAVSDGLSVAVLERLIDLGPIPGGSLDNPTDTAPVILTASAREYQDEGTPSPSPSHAPRDRNSD